MKMIKRGKVGFVGIVVMVVIALAVSTAAIVLQNSTVPPHTNAPVTCPVCGQVVSGTHDCPGPARLAQ